MGQQIQVLAWQGEKIILSHETHEVKWMVCFWSIRDDVMIDIYVYMLYVQVHQNRSGINI